MRTFFEDQFIPHFEAENPDLKLVLAPIQASEGDYFAKIALAMQSVATAPDIVSLDSFQLNADASAGFLQPLDDFVNQWDEWESYTENLKTSFTAQDGLPYAVPGISGSRGLWYNKDIFRKAGLPAEWQPASWDEILATAQVIKDQVDDVIPLSMNVARSNGEAVTMQTFLMLLYGTGDILFDAENEKWVTHSQGFLDSLQFIDKVFNQRDLAPPLSIAMGHNYDSVMFQEKLPNGQVGIVLDGFWNIGNYLETGSAFLENPEERLEFAAMPTQYGQGDGTITLAGGWGWAIPANSQHHEKSWRVIQALGSKDHQADRSLIEGNLTVRDDSATLLRYTNIPFMEVATEFLENAQFRPAREEYPQISVEIQMAVESVASGTSSPEAPWETFQQNVIRLLGAENIREESLP